MDRISVLFISPGLVYSSESPIFHRKFNVLSKKCRGYLFATADRDEQRQIGDFTCCTMARGRRFFAIKFLKYCIVNAWRIRKREERIDCVVSYDPLTTGGIGWLVKLILNARLVVEVNGVYTSPVVWEEQKDGFDTRIKKTLVPWLMRFVFCMADGIHLLFPEQIDEFKNVVRKKTIASFPCWVPVSFFQNLCEKKEILFVGFPLRIKGVDVLIRAFKTIAPLFPEWNLKILGWYPDKRALEKEMDGHPQICHHEPVPYEEMPEHIGSCGFLVLPSRTEAMGRVLVEAAAAGKARVASNVDGVSTVINDNVDGFLFESESAGELAEKMSLLMKAPDKRKELGEAAQVRASADFSEEVFVKNTLAFLYKVIGR